MVKTYCNSCEKKCSGEVLRVQDKFFHIACFKCSVCGKSLAKGGFFQKDGAYLCTQDYQTRFGTKCAICSKYVEGEVVTMKGATYHQQCFTCANCKSPFPSGERVTFVGKSVLCSKCSGLPPDANDVANITNSINSGGCSGCGGELKEGQALIALDRQWHVSCFKCTDCSAILHGEYMGKDGVPYCEKDYQKRFGVKCAYCTRFISGKVLQAGDNHHFHPTCARCTKCGDPFGDGEEMYLQGSAIWHPRCGPGPQSNGVSHSELEHISNSDIQLSLRSQGTSINGSIYGLKRAGSPGLVLREYKGYQGTDISRIYTYSYLTEQPTYLRKPIDPYDKAPVSPHFHRPAYMSGSMRGRSCKSVSSGGAISSLAESLHGGSGGRPRSPHMNNEEPIELAHWPDAHRPRPSDTPKIERDDFPAPPYPYTDPERRRRWSDSFQAIQPDSDEEDETDTSSTLKGEKKVNGKSPISSSAAAVSNSSPPSKPSGMSGGKPGTLSTVLLQGLKERERVMRQRKLDPRNASRSPSASSQPSLRLRYQSPVNASPSRNLDAPKPWDDEDSYEVSSYRSSVGRSNPTLPTYNVYNRSYGRASTLPASISPQMMGDFSYSGIGGMGEKHPSTDFSSAKSDVSAGSISEVDRAASMCGGYIRRSLPNMCAVQHAGKVYPYHLLMTSNYRLPPDVDRCNLERHLSEAEFESLFGFARNDFYRLPQWKRNDLKRKLRLF